MIKTDDETTIASAVGDLSHDSVTNNNSSTEDTADEQILHLARSISSAVSNAAGPQSLFPKPGSKALNPEDPSFNPRQWARAFYQVQVEALGNTPNTAGLAFQNVNVFGTGTPTDYQSSVGNYVLRVVELVKGAIGSAKHERIDILRDLEGLVHSGEMLCVLGPPGSGCSTLLKTLAGNTYGLQVADDAVLNYQGISSHDMNTKFRGEAIYTAEVDSHFPKLTVGQTLNYAAYARCPENLPNGISKHQYAEHLSDVAMAMLNIAHTKNTPVGNDYIRGVSGGERKRVSIAEAMLSYSPWQCWDNSTRGLDSQNAIEFCRTLRLQSDVFGCSAYVAIYQAPQKAYEVFDKVIVLYEGRQIFFGTTTEAKPYFEDLGFLCPEQQTTPDFLTSMTSATERNVNPSWKGKTPPRSPDEFALAWKESKHRQALIKDIKTFESEFPLGGQRSEQFSTTRIAQQSRFQRPASPFTLSYLQQIKLNLWRNYMLWIGDPWLNITMLITNIMQTLIVTSVFYNMPADSSSLSKRNIFIFYMTLQSALGSFLEIFTLYAKRTIVEKHSRYALAHPSTEAIAAIIMDLPYKILGCVLTSLVAYMMGNLRREPGPFFFYLLLSFSVSITMSTAFRFMGSITKTIVQASAPSCIMFVMIMIFSGFTIPQGYLSDWIGWLRWINPSFYALESLVLNEFVGRNFSCAAFVPRGPGYDSRGLTEKACELQGSIPGTDLVSGEEYVRLVYSFSNGHQWRNFGILVGLIIAFLIAHLIAVEYITSERSTGEVLVFPRKALKKRARRLAKTDVETIHAAQFDNGHTNIVHENDSAEIEKQTSIFHWQDVCYSLQIGNETRTILDHVDGWVKPGTLTALMGVSGAGKTSLLDVLASRVTMGVVSGQMLVDGRLRDSSFQRKTGYVTQQDLHLYSATVREALEFSALLRQPPRYTTKEKIAYVDEVLKLIGLEDCADAVIGSLGEGLNVEQRKRLTIGVELAARPALLLFLDEPTSGLDSQTSWSICDLMEKLARSGQAILCTIHQPSGALFQRFDRLLLLASGGRTVYFGPVGKNSHILIDYLARNGAPTFDSTSNPAEYMLESISKAPQSRPDTDWHAIWRSSPEYQNIQDELSKLADSEKAVQAHIENDDPAAYAEFATDRYTQLVAVTKRIFQQYWRTPSYIFSRIVITMGPALFIGLSQVNGKITEQGLKNQLFAILMFLFIFGQVVQQMMPMFVSQRTLYEARERPAKAYHWSVFLIASVVAESTWNSLMAVFSFIFWYFPLGLYHNAEWTDSVHSRGITMFLFVWAFLILASTFGNLIIAGVGSEDVAGGIFTLFFILMFVFNGVLASPAELPGFWIFMYRVNPLTYVVESFLSIGLAHAPMTCLPNELLTFNAPSNMTCGDYMELYIVDNGGYLVNNSTSSCSYCKTANTDKFLSDRNMYFDNRWRDFGFIWAYNIFNLVAAMALYWLFRVPKNTLKRKQG